MSENNDVITDNTNKYTKQELFYYKILNDYYKSCSNENIEKIINIINNSSNSISLRIIDWFVTNYSKQRNKINMKTDIHISYKAQLKSYNKKYFDPFKRVHKSSDKFIYYFANVDKYLTTTIGQLMFFKWALQNNIISYIENNYEELKNEMKQYNLIKEKEKESKSKELSSDTLSFEKSYSLKQNGKIILTI